MTAVISLTQPTGTGVTRCLAEGPKQGLARPPQAVGSRLQHDVASRITQLIVDGEFKSGDRIKEAVLVAALNVSRTPIRAALNLLASQGLLESEPNRGFMLLRSSAEVALGNAAFQGAAPTEQAEDQLIVAIAQDRNSERLPMMVSEADLIRRYAPSRSVLVRALAKMAETGLVERNAGYGWRFLTTPVDAAARAESYQFRILLEPAALLLRSFVLDRPWAEKMRQLHLDAMAAPRLIDGASVAFYEMNAEFHEGLSAASGNRFMLSAIQQQNRLRRFRNYEWTHGQERVIVSCREHLEILDCLENGDQEVASLLMRRHLQRGSELILK